MQLRRTVRDFSDCSVPRKVIEDCIRAAGTAPNGANLQPWHFVAISDPELKRQIRVAAEIEEGFLNGILGRPPHEKPFLLLVVGHPAEAAMVPNIFRKPLEEISSFRTGEG
jgi:nitroreductase